MTLKNLERLCRRIQEKLYYVKKEINTTDEHLFKSQFARYMALSNCYVTVSNLLDNSKHDAKIYSYTLLIDEFKQKLSVIERIVLNNTFTSADLLHELSMLAKDTQQHIHDIEDKVTTIMLTTDVTLGDIEMSVLQSENLV